MLKSDVLCQLASQMGLIPPAWQETAQRFRIESGERPFHDWAAESGTMNREQVTAVEKAFHQSSFRCRSCQAISRGKGLTEDNRELACPSCGSRELARVARGHAETNIQGTLDAPLPPPTAAMATPTQPPAGPTQTMASPKGLPPTQAIDDQDVTMPPAVNQTLFEVSGSAANMPPPATPASGDTVAQTLGVAPTPEDMEKGLQPGQMIGNWEIVKLAGRGGMGVVYQARHETLNQYAAIKILNADYLESSTQAQRFKEEARQAALLDHPNIVAVRDFGQIAGRAYLIMQWVDGDSLNDRIRASRTGLPVRDALAIALQCCAGLQEAHDNTIIHRDIKPDNIMIQADTGRVKVADFGLAKQLSADEKLTQTGYFLGTPAYISPEQVNAEPVSPASDIYSLGATIYHSLTGKVPFKGPNVAAVLFMHTSEPFPSARELNPNVPEELDILLQRMCAKQPEDRVQSMAEVAEYLSAILTELGGPPEALTPVATAIRTATSQTDPGTVLARLTESGRAQRTMQETMPEQARPSGEETPAGKGKSKLPLAVIVLLLLLAAGAIAAIVGMQGGGNDNGGTPVASENNYGEVTPTPDHGNTVAPPDNDAGVPPDPNGNGTGTTPEENTPSDPNPDPDPNPEPSLPVERIERLKRDLQAYCTRPETNPAAVQSLLREVDQVLATHPEAEAELKAGADALRAYQQNLNRALGLMRASREITEPDEALEHLLRIEVLLAEESGLEPLFAEVTPRLEAIAESGGRGNPLLFMREVGQTLREGREALEAGDLDAYRRAIAEAQGYRRRLETYEPARAMRVRFEHLRSEYHQFIDGVEALSRHMVRLEDQIAQLSSDLDRVDQAFLDGDYITVREAQAREPEVLEAIAEMQRGNPAARFEAYRQQIIVLEQRVHDIAELPTEAPLTPEGEDLLARAQAAQDPPAARAALMDIEAYLEEHPEYRSRFAEVEPQLRELAGTFGGEGQVYDPDLPENTRGFQRVGPLVLTKVHTIEPAAGDGRVLQMRFTPNGESLLLTQADSPEAYLIAVESGDQEAVFGGVGEPVLSIAVNAAGSEGLIGMADATVQKVGIQHRLPWNRTFHGHRDAVSSICYAPADGERQGFLAGAADGDLMFFSAATGAPAGWFRGHEDAVVALDVFHSPRRSLLASGSRDGTARVWDVESEDEICVFDEHREPLTDVAFVRGGDRVVTASEDATLRLFDARSGDERRVYRGHGSAVTGVEIAPMGFYLYSSSTDGSLRIWSVLNGDPLAYADLNREAGYRLTALALSQNGRQLAVGTHDGHVLVFDVLADWRPR